MLRAALLDMYNGEDNRGIPMLKSLFARYESSMTMDHFDVRLKNEIAGLDYDIYVFSGGPGDPLEDDKPWVEPFYQLIRDLWAYNRTHEDKKYCLFICHSFQIASHVFKLGTVSERAQMSFGTYPVHKTHEGKFEPVFEGLPDPFYIADFRRYQVVQPNKQNFKIMGAEILCLEKLRPHLHYERAIMAIRFSPEMVGTQFHPEADPNGMLVHFQQPARHEAVVSEHGEPRYRRMMADLNNPHKIEATFNTIIPTFLENSIQALEGVTV